MAICWTDVAVHDFVIIREFDRALKSPLPMIFDTSFQSFVEHGILHLPLNFDAASLCCSCCGCCIKPSRTDRDLFFMRKIKSVHSFTRKIKSVHSFTRKIKSVHSFRILRTIFGRTQIIQSNGRSKLRYERYLH